jgi:hypothetical protein
VWVAVVVQGVVVVVVVVMGVVVVVVLEEGRVVVVVLMVQKGTKLLPLLLMPKRVVVWEGRGEGSSGGQRPGLHLCWL